MLETTEEGAHNFSATSECLGISAVGSAGEDGVVLGEEFFRRLLELARSMLCPDDGGV